MGSYRLTSQPPAAGGAAALHPRRGRLSGALAGAQRRAQPAFLPHQVPALGSPRPAPSQHGLFPRRLPGTSSAGAGLPR